MPPDRVTPAGVADPALLELECAGDQQVRPSGGQQGRRLPARPAASAYSAADGTTRELHPVSRTPAADQPTMARRVAQPPLRQPAQRRTGHPVPPPAARPAPPLAHPQTQAQHGQRPAGPVPERARRPAGPITRVVDDLPRALPRHEPRPDPGSAGERLLQCAFGSRDRADRFYRDQVLDHLNQAMIAFVGRMELAFIGTADAGGECDSSLRAGPPGFLHVLDERRIAYPEYRGNGVLASLGNISENPHVGMLLVDFTEDLIGLHVNGRARIVEDADLRAEWPGLPAEFERVRTPERWVVVHVVEAYVHCRKHIPRMQVVARNRDWGTDDARRKGGDYFGVRADQSSADQSGADQSSGQGASVR